MYRKAIPLLSLLAGILVGCSQVETTSVDRIPTDQTNANYPSNAAPLVPQQFIKLPAGSIAPGGWIKKELELQKDGLNGHLGEISRWLDKNDNQWLGNGGTKGWEEVPYWLRGYSSLAWILGDQKMKDESMVWIEAILASQKEDGNFGPVVLRNGRQDLWPNMLALTLLQDYYEYSGDGRIIPFMTNYFKYELTIPDEDFLEDYWENSRAGDNLLSVIWLYNLTKEPWLIDLMKKLHANTADWEGDSYLPNWHNVNVAQCFREPATYYVVSHDSTDLRASYNVQSLIRRTFGQVPGGMFGSDENCRLGYIDPRQGTETCGFAEQMWSDEIMLLITGDPAWAENFEDVTFNSYPAAFMPDMKSLRYITSPNQAISSKVNHSPGIQNGGPFMAMNPFSNRCCQHNHGFAWPYYNEYLMLATPDNGAAAVLFNACTAKMKVADGQEITIEESTHYPFEENIHFRISCASDVKFPFYIRIPSWCDNPSVKVAGKSVSNIESGKYLRIERTWTSGDLVEVSFPMHISTRTWQVNQNSMSVDYGPLTLSLEIGEDYKSFSPVNFAMGDSQWQSEADTAKWLGYEILPTTNWNYALVTDYPVTVEKNTEWPADDNPFTLESNPLHFKAKGRLVPSWKVDKYDLTAVLPEEDAPKAKEIDDIKLVPMGAARLRISAFPTCTSK